MVTAVLLSTLLGPALAAAAATGYPTSSHPHIPSGDCKDFTISAPITSENYQWAIPPYKDNFDVVDFLFNSSRKDSQEVYHPFGDGSKKTVTKTYKISATFCTPKKKHGKEKTVLIATSGLAYDGQYWAPTFKVDEYSFVENAMKAGYSVLYYDRIGTGKSQKESGYIAQSSQASALITYLAESVKAGKYTEKIRAKKIVLVGHSFGSYNTDVAVAAKPDIADAVVLTGLVYPDYSTDAAGMGTSWGPTAFRAEIASTVNAKKWPAKEYDTGYLIFADIYGHIDTFFRNYEHDAAEYAQSILAPLSVAELTSLGFLDLHAPNYKGKVLVTTGEFDLLECGGECYSTFEIGKQEEIWKGASKLETYVHPGAGHGVNFNKNAKAFFDKIFDFIERNVQ